ncbi:MAG: M28 family peptidase [Gelidibacter sp.]
MRKFLLIAGITLALFSCKTTQQSAQNNKQSPTVDPTVYGNTITSSELKDLLYTYASDKFEGRETGERGQKLAVNFLKQQYENLDIPSPIAKDDYFQEVPLTSLKTIKSSITVNGKAFENYTDFVVMGTIPSQTFDVNNIVYAGYGIDDANYSDYKNLDVNGKIVLVKAGEPTNADGTFVISGTTEKTKWFEGRQASSAKRDVAQQKGAKALLLMDDAYFKRVAAYYKKRNESNYNGKIELNDKLKSSMAQILISDTLGKALYTAIETNDVAKTITTNIKINIESEMKAVSSENVVAFIKGSEKPDEILVISSHLDHIGITNGQINNGADDDGSGTVALLEIAEAFKKAQLDGHGPKRSILFLHVTGEEKGLLGSSYYTDVNPIFPLENTVADLNIDMIGRTDPKREGDRNYIYLIGSDKLSTELHELSEEANNKYTHITLDYTYDNDNDPNRYYYRSDHYNFAKNNIPVIFYFNGTHDDYHQPTDTPDKIQYDLLENRARLVFYTAWEIANQPMRIKVDKLNQ